MEQQQNANAPQYSIAIIERHEIVRFGLEMLVAASPNLRLAASVSSLAEGLRLIPALRPDLVISELATGDSSGLDTVRALVAAQGSRPTLIVSALEEAFYAHQAILLGARGYLTKDHAAATVLEAALTVLGGGVWASPDVRADLLRRALHGGGAPAPAAPRGPSLSERELRVMELLKCGMSTKQIAGTLGVSSRTVDGHRACIKRKLGLRTGAELVAFASSRF